MFDSDDSKPLIISISTPSPPPVSRQPVGLVCLNVPRRFWELPVPELNDGGIARTYCSPMLNNAGAKQAT